MAKYEEVLSIPVIFGLSSTSSKADSSTPICHHPTLVLLSYLNIAKVRDEMVPGLSKGTTPLHEVRRINGQIGELLTILRNHFDEYEVAKSQVLIACEIGDRYSTNQKSES